MMTARTRSLVAIAVALVLVAVGWWTFTPRPIPVETATASEREIASSVESEAKTRIHDRFVVSAPVAGRLSRISYEEGDRVRAGEHLAAIDPLPITASIESSLEKLRELQAQTAGIETLRPKEESLAQAQSKVTADEAVARSARARILAAQAAFDQAKRDVVRQDALEREGYAARNALELAQLAQITRQRELQVAQADAAAAQAQVEIDRAAAQELTKKVRDPDYLRGVYSAQAAAVRAQLRVLEDQSKRADITAPVTGDVLRVLQKSEAYVAAGAPLLEIGNRGTLEIVADVLSQDAVTIHVGDPVEVVRGAGSDHPRGVVRLIEPSGYTKISALGIEEQRVNVIATLLERPPSLGDAYRLDVRITTSSGRALAVPIPALVRCGDSWCAYIMKGGRARRTILRVGRMNERDAEIVSGLAAGDTVIVRPPENVREGARVISANSPR